MSFHNTLALSASSSVSLICAAVRNSIKLSHLDIQQAFVQTPLNEEMYVNPLPGCGEVTGKTVKLNKSFYGLKQTSHEFHYLLMA